jgi:hypothetical protein
MFQGVAHGLGSVSPTAPQRAAIYLVCDSLSHRISNCHRRQRWYARNPGRQDNPPDLSQVPYIPAPCIGRVGGTLHYSSLVNLVSQLPASQWTPPAFMDIFDDRRRCGLPHKDDENYDRRMIIQHVIHCSGPPMRPNLQCRTYTTPPNEYVNMYTESYPSGPSEDILINWTHSWDCRADTT